MCVPNRRAIYGINLQRNVEASYTPTFEDGVVKPDQDHSTRYYPQVTWVIWLLKHSMKTSLTCSRTGILFPVFGSRHIL